ncbi:MAG: N-acetylmuramic acid 6-phosphate etherase [Bacilli bacterium]|nr:N-acetylmuramic acid 6-phosphate etherase [Bacilli bacterium]
MSIDIKKISTESRLENSYNIDQMETIDILKTINNEDKTVPVSVEQAIQQIVPLVDKIVSAIENGGRLIYMGAGTSGRIGLLDAVECPPTYGVSDETIMCLLAGGKNAFSKAVEGAEDSKELAVQDLKEANLSKNDVVVGIAASGRTPYVIGGIEYAKSVGCITGCIVNAKASVLASIVDYPVEAVTGSEVISGSTRMKSGTAQKLVCNMISTSVMVKLGHVYHNLMIDVQATNEKLVARQLGIIQEAIGCSKEEASLMLKKYKTVKKAIFAYITNIDEEEKVEEILKGYKYNLPVALREYK